MNTVKTTKKSETRRSLGIREITGPSKMGFVIDSMMKRQIVFKPV